MEFLSSHLETVTVAIISAIVGGFIQDLRHKLKPFKQDAELYERLIKKLTEKSFTQETQNHYWASKFVYSDLSPLHDLINEEESKEFRFVDRKMEKKRKRLFQAMYELYRIIARKYDDAGLIPSMNTIYYRPRDKYFDENKEDEVFNEVRSICDKIYNAYKDFHDTGLKKFGERL